MRANIRAWLDQEGYQARQCSDGKAWFIFDKRTQRLGKLFKDEDTLAFWIAIKIAARSGNDRPAELA